MKKRPPAFFVQLPRWPLDLGDSRVSVSTLSMREGVMPKRNPYDSTLEWRRDMLGHKIFRDVLAAPPMLRGMKKRHVLKAQTLQIIVLNATDETCIYRPRDYNILKRHVTEQRAHRGARRWWVSWRPMPIVQCNDKSSTTLWLLVLVWSNLTNA